MLVSRLYLENFKSFRKAELHLGSLTTLIGINASGKSNLKDALQFLQGVGRGYELSEILGPKWGDGGEKVWKGIRGGIKDIVYHGADEKRFVIDVDLEDHFFNDNRFRAIFSIEVDLRLNQYRFLMVNNDSIARYFSEAIFQKLIEEKFSLNMKSIRFYDLSSTLMTNLVPRGEPILSTNGENLSSVIELICRDRVKKQTLLSWLQELTPNNVEDIDFFEDLQGNIIAALIENGGNRISVYSASDGTLRFLAIMAALLSPEPARVYFFEELEKSIHPSRLYLLVEFLERMVEEMGVQVIVTTHSPQVLGFLSEDSLKYASLIHREDKNNGSKIIPLVKIPNYEKALSIRGVGDLQSMGWFETVMAAVGGDVDEL